MILLLLHLAAACDTDASLLALRNSAFREDYLCLARATSGGTVLERAIPNEADANVRARYTRALALWILERPDQAISASQARLLPADDRRLVADGIHARAGRPSPAPEHVVVFEQQGWYHPDPQYTDGRLSPLDLANIAVMDRPPAAPPVQIPPVETPASEEPVAQPPQETRYFGCNTVTQPGLWGLALWMFAWRRRPA